MEALIAKSAASAPPVMDQVTVSLAAKTATAVWFSFTVLAEVAAPAKKPGFFGRLLERAQKPL